MKGGGRDVLEEGEMKRVYVGEEGDGALVVKGGKNKGMG